MGAEDNERISSGPGASDDGCVGGDVRRAVWLGDEWDEWGEVGGGGVAVEVACGWGGVSGLGALGEETARENGDGGKRVGLEHR